MYGKLFGSMFEGSLYGQGWGPLLVMSYVIANGVPDRAVGMQVDLNPESLAHKFGESEEEVARAIEFLCQPDPRSTSPEEGGRRLIKLGTFSYKVVNGMKYRAIRNEEERRAQVRQAMVRYRKKKDKEKANRASKNKRMPGNAPTMAERLAERGLGGGGELDGGE